MKKLSKLLLVLVQLGLAGAAQAVSVSTVSLSTTTPTVTHPSSVSFNVYVNFTETASMGSFDLEYDNSIQSLTGFSYNCGTISSLIAACSDTFTVDTNTIGFIKDIGFNQNVSGDGILGTATFKTWATGTANLNTQAGIFRDLPNANNLEVFYSGTSVQVSAVPVPAALWLMASGLSALGLGMRRRRA